MERAKEGICELVLSWEKVRSIRYSLDKVLGIVNAWPDAPGQKTVVAILNSINTQLTPKGHPFSTSELLEVNQGTQPHEQRTLSTYVERFFAPVTTSKTKVFSAAPSSSSSSSTTSSPSSCFSLEEKQALYRQLTATNEEKDSKKDKRRRLYLAEGVEESNETVEKKNKENEALLAIVGATQKAERAKNARHSMKRRWTASDEEREEEEAEQEQVIPVAAMDEVKEEEKPTKECNVNEQRRGKEESEEENLSAMVLVETRQQTEPNDFNSFSLLPAEMCTDIFMRLSIAEWNAMAKVSKGFRAYFTSDAFWGSVKHFSWSPFHQQQLSSNFFSTCVPHMHRLQSLHINGTCFSSKNKEACLNFFLNNLPLPSSPSSSSSSHANTKDRERERGLSTLVLRNYRLTDFRISSIAHRCGPYLRRLSLGEDCGGLHVEPLLNLLRCCSATLRSLTFGCLASAAETQRFLDAAAALCGGRLQELNILLTRCQPVLSLVSVAQHCRSRPRSRDRCYRWNNEEEAEEEEGGLRLLSVLGMPLEGQGLTLVEGLPAVLKRCGRRLERCQFTNICFAHVYEEEVTSPTTSFSSLRNEEERNGEEENEEEGNDVRTLKRRRRERRTRTRSRSSSLTSTLPPPTHSSPLPQQSEHQEGGGEEDEETIIRRDANAWKMLERMPRLEELWLEGLFGRSATTFIRLLQTDHCPQLRVLSLPSVGTFAIQDIIRIVENHQPEGDEEEKDAENERSRGSRGRRGLRDVLLHDCSLVGPEEVEMLHQRFPRIRFRTPTLFPPYLRREGERGAAPSSFS
ncbi:hypothetical protein QOT17_003510 [Balamuthia mandrillaris]